MDGMTPQDMASAAVGAKLIWALIDVAVAVLVFTILTKVPGISRLVFEYDDVLDKSAQDCRDGKLDPECAALVATALARVKGTRMLGLMIIMAAALLE